MSDFDELNAAFDNGALLRPSADTPNIVDLARALASLNNADGIPPTSNSNALQTLIGPADHYVFVLVDGLGMNFIENLQGDTFLASHLATELRTVFPSATAVALTSFATGEWPGAHAVMGWWVHLKQINASAAIIQFVTRSNRIPLAKLGVKVEQAFPIPSLMNDMRRNALALFPERIADTTYSNYFSGYRITAGYRSLQNAVDQIVARIRVADAPTYTYLYTHRVDSAAHEYGTGHREVEVALTELDGEMRRLHDALGDRIRIVLSADHGFLDVPVQMRHQIKASDPLMSLLQCPPSGDARVLYLHVRDDAHAKVREYFGKRFGERFFIVSADEAEQLELFGPSPLSPTARNRLGDLIVISKGVDVIEYRPSGVLSRVLTDAAHHSGLTPEEMRVPLVIA